MPFQIDSPQTVTVTVTSGVDVTEDEIRLVRIDILNRPNKNPRMEVAWVTGYEDGEGRFNRTGRYSRAIKAAATTNILSTAVVSGTVLSNLEQQIFNHLSQRGVLPSGVVI